MIVRCSKCLSLVRKKIVHVNLFQVGRKNEGGESMCFHVECSSQRHHHHAHTMIIIILIPVRMTMMMVIMQRAKEKFHVRFHLVRVDAYMARQALPYLYVLYVLFTRKSKKELLSFLTRLQSVTFLDLDCIHASFCYSGNSRNQLCSRLSTSKKPVHILFLFSSHFFCEVQKKLFL